MGREVKVGREVKIVGEVPRQRAAKSRGAAEEAASPLVGQSVTRLS